MKHEKTLFGAILTAAMLAGGCAENDETKMTLNGAGASFPAPVYQAWTHDYTAGHPNVHVNYQSLGSGAGLNQIKAGTIDYAGSDNPLTLEDQKASGLQQFPMLMGGVVVIVNVPGVPAGQLKLSREAVSDIFLGKITKWNDAKIAALNASLALPDLDITVVHRADSSGTSFIFTDYLSRISPEWKEKVGAGSAVKWPTGIGGQKNPGVCNSVAKISGSIGYTEYTYAKEAKLAMAQLENRAGRILEPVPETFAASVASADWENAPGFYMILNDQPGDNAWPIMGVTYIFLRADCPAARRAELSKYFNWCFTDGVVTAKKLDYVPLPEKVVGLIRSKILK